MKLLKLRMPGRVNEVIGGEDLGSSVVVSAAHEVAAMVANQLAAVALEPGAARGAHLANMLEGFLSSGRTTLRDFFLRFARIEAGGEGGQHG